MTKSRILIAIFAVITVLEINFGFGFAPSEEVARKAATTMGFRNISVTNKSRFFKMNCGRGDIIQYDARATNSNNNSAEITICCGILKSCTIRAAQ